MEGRGWGGLHVIADWGTGSEATPVAIAGAALAGGARIIQVRVKGAASRALYDWADRVAALVRKHPGARLVVNDRVDVALAVGADAVHLGEGDLSPADAREAIAASGRPLACGLSTHDIAQARRAARAGAAYIGFGPVFPSSSKADALPPRGIDRLAEVCRRVPVPVIAIGGIDLAGAREAAKAGAAGVAVISAVANAPDMRAATEALAAVFQAAC